MSVAVGALPGGEARRYGFGARIADWTIAAIVFLGGFVIVEPAPYDLVLVAVVLVWACFGLRLNRHFLPMTVLLLLYVAGGFLSFSQLEEYGEATIYMATTVFLMASSIFFAAVIVEAPDRRMRLIRRAYIASALVVAVIAILAYFNAIPNADYFKLYDRAKGTFQDPNVFGPFLIMPAALLARDILTSRLRDSLWQVLWLLIIIFAVFLSFSRAAWGLTVIVLLITALLAFLTEKRQLARFRLVAYLVSGMAAIVMLIGAAVSIPAVRDLYVQRAQVLQDYDAGRHGRFERSIMGFFLIQEKPLGLGPFEFGKIFGEDEHNMWLKGFTVYGWLGGFSYIILAIWTLAAATPLIFKPRPWQGFVQCAYAVFLGHLLIHIVIDNDHWRHVFLIYGILWGAIAAEKMYARERRRLSLSRPMVAPVFAVSAAAVPRANL